MHRPKEWDALQQALATGRVAGVKWLDTLETMVDWAETLLQIWCAGQWSPDRAPHYIPPATDLTEWHEAVFATYGSTCWADGKSAADDAHHAYPKGRSKRTNWLALEVWHGIPLSRKAHDRMGRGAWLAFWQAAALVRLVSPQYTVHTVPKLVRIMDDSMKCRR